MKKLSYALLTLCVLLLASCSGNNDLESLLATVPSNSAVVVGIDLAQLNTKAGDTDKGDKNVLSDEMESVISMMGRDGKELRQLLEGESGIALTSLAIYEYQDEVVVTGYTTDDKKFIDFFEEEGMSFSKKGDGYVSERENGVVLNGRFWICSGELKMSKCESFLDLDKDDSILSNPCVSRLLDKHSDIVALVDVEKATSLGGVSSSDAAAVRMMLAAAFNNAKYFAGTLVFDKGKAMADILVLDSKGEPAKTAVKLNKVNTSMLKSFPGKADVLYALALDPASINNIGEQFGSLGLPPEMMTMLRQLKGNIVVGFDIMTTVRNNFNPGFGIMADFDTPEHAQQAAELFKQAIGYEATVKFTGNQLYLANNLPDGKPSAAMTSGFDDACMGIVFDTSALEEASGSKALGMVKLVSVFARVDNGAFKLAGTVKMKDEESNALLSLLRMVKQFEKDAPAINSAFTPSMPAYDEFDTAIVEEVVCDSAAADEYYY